MLYITTRTDRETYTSRCTLKDSLAPDGGYFIPAELPLHNADQLAAMREKTFGDIVADILNLFFSNQLNGWDVDFCIGRNVLRLVSMNHRIAIAELWHNLEGNYSYIVKELHKKVLNCDNCAVEPSEWFKVALGIAALFGVYGELLKEEMLHLNQAFDISLAAGDFTMPMAAWYARKMGLPIETVICTCEENSPVWDLIHRGSFNTTLAPQACQQGIERLVQATLGYENVHDYIERCKSSQSYFIPDGVLETFNRGFFCAVPGKVRAPAVINSVYRTNAYFIDPFTALCYGGMQDYRARTGDSRVTLLIAEQSPSYFTDEITSAAGVSAELLMNTIKQA